MKIKYKRAELVTCLGHILPHKLNEMPVPPLTNTEKERSMANEIVRLMVMMKML